MRLTYISLTVYGLNFVTACFSGQGVATTQFTGVSNAIEKIAAQWYYNWGLVPLSNVKSEFVPMVWGKKQLLDLENNPNHLSQVMNSSHILGFNEFDHKDQANMTVTEVLDGWQKINLWFPKSFLVSPCVAINADQQGGLFDQFMQGSVSRGLRVDAIALHQYPGWKQYPSFNPSQMANQILQYVDNVHKLCKKRIWLTEFNGWDFSVANGAAPMNVQQQIFKILLPQLQSRPYVQRYSWFILNPGHNYSLAITGGNLTTLGKTYKTLKNCTGEKNTTLNDVITSTYGIVLKPTTSLTFPTSSYFEEPKTNILFIVSLSIFILMYT